MADARVEQRHELEVTRIAMMSKPTLSVATIAAMQQALANAEQRGRIEGAEAALEVVLREGDCYEDYPARRVIEGLGISAARIVAAWWPTPEAKEVP